MTCEPATGPVAAERVHHTDPRVGVLAETAHAASPDDARTWHELDWHARHAYRTAARDWLRAAVTVGLLPLIEPSTGDALGPVVGDVDPFDGRPRARARFARRAVCSVCGLDRALNVDGRIRHHPHQGPGRWPCDGSHKPPAGTPDTTPPTPERNTP